MATETKTEKLARIVAREVEAQATLKSRHLSTQNRLQAENVLAECAMQRGHLSKMEGEQNGN